MGKFKKKKIIILGIGLFLISVTSYKLINKPKELEKPKEEKKEQLAMYLEDEAGAFQISNSKTFPKEGYLLDHAECKNGGTVTQNPETKELSASFSKGDSCNLYFAKERLPLLDSILAKANDVTVTTYSSGNTGEMYTFEHDEATQTTGWNAEERRDYRYIGKAPNNWLKFNDEDWRIIGVFTVETAIGKKEQLIKIIRNESIGSLEWDSSNVNEWASSSLKALLNTGDYYNRLNTYASTGLNETARSQIEEVKWYLGGSSESENLGGPDCYSFERGAITCVTTERCSGEIRNINTIAKVGLMYPSDYVYTYANGVDNTCYTNGFDCKTSSGATPANGWLYNNISQWTISPFNSRPDYAFMDVWSSYLGLSSVYSLRDVHPSVYLRTDIKMISGDGASSETAYILE